MYSHPTLVNEHRAALSKQQSHSKPAMAACVFEASSTGEAQLFPEGRFKATDGRPHEIVEGWLMNADIAERVIERAQQRKNRILVDYEHQTLYTKDNGQPAPAAGWINSADLQYREGLGLFAKVAWTAKAKQMIQDGEYLYISPVFAYDPRTGEALHIEHVTLTNNPALDGMAEARAAARKKQSQSSNPMETDEMKLEQLIALLKLAKDSTEEQVQAELSKLMATSESHAALTKALGVSDDADTETVTTAVAALKAKTFDPSKHVPLAAFEALKQEVATLKAGSADEEVEALVKQGLTDGKLLPAQEDWAKDLGKKDVAALKKYFDTTPAIAALNKQQSADKPNLDEQGNVTLTTDELAICKAMGVSKEDYIAALKAE